MIKACNGSLTACDDDRFYYQRNDRACIPRAVLLAHAPSLVTVVGGYQSSTFMSISYGNVARPHLEKTHWIADHVLAHQLQFYPSTASGNNPEIRPRQ